MIVSQSCPEDVSDVLWDGKSILDEVNKMLRTGRGRIQERDEGFVLSLPLELLPAPDLVGKELQMAFLDEIFISARIEESTGSKEALFTDARTVRSSKATAPAQLGHPRESVGSFVHWLRESEAANADERHCTLPELVHLDADSCVFRGQCFWDSLKDPGTGYVYEISATWNEQEKTATEIIMVDNCLAASIQARCSSNPWLSEAQCVVEEVSGEGFDTDPSSVHLLSTHFLTPAQKENV